MKNTVSKHCALLALATLILALAMELLWVYTRQDLFLALTLVFVFFTVDTTARLVSTDYDSKSPVLRKLLLVLGLE